MKNSQILLALVIIASLSLMITALPVNAQTTKGCSPGYWANHTQKWVTLKPNQTLGTIFTVPITYSVIASDTLLTALKYPGGSSTLDKVKIMLRQAVAGDINAYAFTTAYPYSTATVVSNTNAAMASAANGDLTYLATWQNQLIAVNDPSGTSCTDPTAVTISTMNVSRSPNGTTFSWITGNELESAGFYVYRSGDKVSWSKVNDRLVPSSGGVVGTNYQILDQQDQGARYYRLEELDNSGKSTLFNPQEVLDVKSPSILDQIMAAFVQFFQ